MVPPHRGVAPLALLALGLLACASTEVAVPQVQELYRSRAQREGPVTRPLVVIPGLLGSTLIHSGTKVWGSFTSDASDPSTARGARLLSLPFVGEGERTPPDDGLEVGGTLGGLELDLIGIPFKLSAYVQIVDALGIGGYAGREGGGALERTPSQGYSCFQFSYDWRRSNAHNARYLYLFLRSAREIVRRENLRRYGSSPPIKFDIVAHSMGSLLTRYCLRYGDAPLPPLDLEPRPTWKGAELVERVIMIGAPNAGSSQAMVELLQGVSFAPILPRYPAALLGTFESGYELLPRSRHRRIRGPRGQPIADLYDPELWISRGWGLASPAADDFLARVLPDASPPARREAARRHLRHCLDNARRLQRALDVESAPPPGLELFLIAGDAVRTKDVLWIADDGRPQVRSRTLGDGTVTRASALLDERVGSDSAARRVASPIRWRGVHFIFSDHLGMTAEPSFVDNVLYLLLDAPRASDRAGG